MAEVYLDNGATTFPKAPGVSEAIKNFVDHASTNVNRSGYGVEFAGEELVYETREMLCQLYNFPHPQNLIFTQNATMGLNFLVKGLLKSGDHCLVSSLEHNAVMRPLSQLKDWGVQFSRIPCSPQGFLNPQSIQELLRPSTKAVFLTHASNVSGTILPLAQVGKICAENGVFFIVDTAQTGGSLPVDFQKLQIDALVFTGHKGLLGPQGIGGFAIAPELVELVDPLMAGGTGSLSESEEQPSYLPDKYEAGTINLPGIAGLNAALRFINQESLENIRQKETTLTSVLHEGLGNLSDLRVIGPDDVADKTAIVSVDCRGLDNAQVAFSLNKQYGIRTRCGLHCAPSAHKTLNTFPQGTVRFSPGYFNTKKEMDYTISSMQKVLKELSSVGK